MRFVFFAIAIIIGAASQPALAVVLSYEGFDYPNSGSNLLTGLSGGSGWGGPWSFFGGIPPEAGDTGHRVSQDDLSLDSAAFPFTPSGDRVNSKGVGPGNNTWADRRLSGPFDFSAEGQVRYFSFLFQKNSGGATSEDNMEFNLWSSGATGPITQVRLGSTSAERFFLYHGASPPAGALFDDPIVIGQTYFMVLKIESHATSNDIFSANTYAPSETVPTVEPATWEETNSVGMGALIEGMRLWIGVPTTGSFDEIREGTSWEDVAVGSTFPTGDFNQNGVVDGADYVVWRKGLESGKFQPSDYNLWRQNFGATSMGTAVSDTVPEPATGLMLLTVLLPALMRTIRPCRCVNGATHAIQ